MALDTLKFVMEDDITPKTKIRVFGIGGAGGNAVARMLNEGLSGVEFCVLNTDAQALSASPVPNQLAIGSKITSGLGAGSDPAVGRQAALEDTEKIIDLLEGADMVFVTAGLGGGTGTGAAPVVASLAKELGALTVAVITKPFGFEGPQAPQGGPSIGLRGARPAWSTPSSPSPTISSSNWFPKGPASSNRFAWPTTSCARPFRGSRTSSPLRV